MEEEEEEKKRVEQIQVNVGKFEFDHMDNRQDVLSNNGKQEIVIEEHLKKGTKSEFNLLGEHKQINSNIDIES